MWIFRCHVRVCGGVCLVLSYRPRTRSHTHSRIHYTIAYDMRANQNIRSTKQQTDALQMARRYVIHTVCFMHTHTNTHSAYFTPFKWLRTSAHRFACVYVCVSVPL